MRGDPRSGTVFDSLLVVSAGVSRRGERRLVEVKRVGGLSVKDLMRSSVVAEAQVAGHAEFGPGDAVAGVWRVERFSVENFKILQSVVIPAKLALE